MPYLHKLNTVTYDTSLVSCLGAKMLQFIAKKYSRNYPEVSRSILNNFHMDNLLVCTNPIEEIKQPNTSDLILVDEDVVEEKHCYRIAISDKLGTETLGQNWVPF